MSIIRLEKDVKVGERKRSIFEVFVADNIEGKCNNTSSIVVSNISEYAEPMRSVLYFFRTGTVQTTDDIVKQMDLLAKLDATPVTTEEFAKQLINHSLPEFIAYLLSSMDYEDTIMFEILKYLGKFLASKPLDGLPLHAVVAWLMNHKSTVNSFSNDTLLQLNRWVIDNGDVDGLQLIKRFFPYNKLSDVFLEQVTPLISWAALTKKEHLAVRAASKLSDDDTDALGDFPMYWSKHARSMSARLHEVTLPQDNFRLEGFNFEVAYDDNAECVSLSVWIDIGGTQTFLPEVMLININDNIVCVYDGMLEFDHPTMSDVLMIGIPC